MKFYDKLVAATEAARTDFLSIPFLQEGVAGRLTLDQYIAFLTQAYHHVKHTLPLLMACGARLPERMEWLRTAVAEYIEEETGHQEWILSDITAFGRNVAPEWVERELVVEDGIVQAAVFGEASAINVAIVVPRPGAHRAAIDSAIHSANDRLPDYARVSSWILADSPFTVDNGLLTATGRPRRRAILETYGTRLNQLFESNTPKEQCA